MGKAINKIAIIGNAGGGKTTLARALAQKTGLPLTHVDRVQFIEGMKIRPYKESIEILSRVHENPQWIIDGYGPLDIIEKRFALADCVILIDLPLWRHFWWGAKRQIQNLWSRREELPSGCDERNWKHSKKLFKTMWNAHKQMRPELLRILARPQLKEKVLIVRSVSELNRLKRRGL